MKVNVHTVISDKPPEEDMAPELVKRHDPAERVCTEPAPAEPAAVGAVFETAVPTTSAGEPFQAYCNKAASAPPTLSHYFSNFITVINGYSTLALNNLSPASPAYRQIQMILEAGERAAEKVRELQDSVNRGHGIATVPLTGQGQKAVSHAHLEEVVAMVQRLKQ